MSANPYARVEIPAIGRVWQALQTLAARLQSRTLQISIRTLAAEAGLASAGHITKHLKQLEADGHIAYDPQTSIVIVTLGRIDPSADQKCQPSADQCDESPDVDPVRVRVKTSCMVHETHESHESVSEARKRAEHTPSLDDPNWPAWEALGVYPWVYPDLQRDFAHVTLEQFRFWCQHYHTKNNPAAYVISLLQRGIALPQQRPQSAASTAKRTRGRSTPSAPQMPPPPTADDEERNARAWQQVAALLPRTAPMLDQAELAEDLMAGYSAPEALERLAARRSAGAT